MSLDNAQQFENILKTAKHALIFMPQNFGGDALGSAWAMYFFLKKNGSEATVVVPGDNYQSDRFSFLQKPEDVIESLAGARDFVLAFNTEHNKITNVRTDRSGEELRIFITPEKGSIDPRDFSFIPAKFKYDTVIVLGSPDKESLGKIYEENPDIFYEVPVINIDHHAENDSFGQVNVLDMTASSTAEILADMLIKFDEKNIDEIIAECLLVGIIDATNSFQKKNTTPKSLQIAAILMAKGANQQKIIRYLYKTQPFHLLKLWGRIMARLSWEDDLNLAWAPVYIEDFVQSRSTPAELSFVLDKIKENYATGKILMVLFNETTQQIRGIIKCGNADKMKLICETFGAKANGETCEFADEATDAAEAGQRTVEKLRACLIAPEKTINL
jgi:nanoRNase/pAp phosphatase (c-di-AMP/oligoRNAs hydrolase)